MTKSYEPGPDYEECAGEPVLDISINNSTELWLIQWPLNQVQPTDFDGKAFSLKLHKDGSLGSVESSSGKSYQVVSLATQGPDATVFLPEQSEMKVAGKISRRVCLVRYPDPEEYKKRSLKKFNSTSVKSGGSSMKSSRFVAMPSNQVSSQGSAGVRTDGYYPGEDPGQNSGGPSQKKRKKTGQRGVGSSGNPPSEVSGR